MSQEITEYILKKALNIRCLICDVDGVLTAGHLYLGDAGQAMKGFHVHDGFGLKLLQAIGIEVAIITGENNEVIDLRMQQLGINYFYKNQKDKLRAFQALKESLCIDNDSFAYVGDDLPDIPVMQKVGLSIAVSNAVNLVKEFADWETTKCGGHGAVREACDLILQAQNKTEKAFNKYIKTET